MFKSMYWMIFSGAKRRLASENAKEFSHLGANEIVPNIYGGYERHSVLNNLKYAEYLGLNTEKSNSHFPRLLLRQRLKLTSF